MVFTKLRVSVFIFITTIFLLTSSQTLACACGCNIFSVGNKWMMAINSGFKFSLQYSYMNQSTNWNNQVSAPAYLNEDKGIRTSFYTMGFQYMPSREWGIMLEVPVWNRYFKTVDEDENPVSTDHSALGDIRITGVYTGLSEDMSTGITLGVKLPTGPIDQSLFDRDTQIGSGSTDILIGGYRMEQNTNWGWFTQVLFQQPLNSRQGYKPGSSFDVNAGVHYDQLLNILPVVPMLQVIGSFRGKDSGINSHPEDTGYQRIYIAPGAEVDLNPAMQLYFDFRIPVSTHVNGYQLVAPSLVNASFSVSL